MRGSRRQGQRRAFAPPRGKVVKCICIIFKTFVGFWGLQPSSGLRLWTPLGDGNPRPPNLPTPGKESCGRQRMMMMMMMMCMCVSRGLGRYMTSVLRACRRSAAVKYRHAYAPSRNCPTSPPSWSSSRRVSTRPRTPRRSICTASCRAFRPWCGLRRWLDDTVSLERCFHARCLINSLTRTTAHWPLCYRFTDLRRSAPCSCSTLTITATATATTTVITVFPPSSSVQSSY